MHCINAGLNVPDNAPLAVYQAALAGNWLVMGLKIDSSPIDARLSKMEAAIENIASLEGRQPCGQPVHGTRGGCGYYSQGCVYERSQVDHGDGQERAPSGQSSYGDLS